MVAAPEPELNADNLLSAVFAGFALGGSLIVAIGAQNAFVLRMGLLRRHVFPLCLTCAVSDALLITLGVAGMGALVAANPGILKLLSLAGAVFLLAYAGLSVRRALAPEAIHVGGETPQSLGKAMVTVLTFTFLNPHVYLDTVALIGSFSASYRETARLLFGAGAVLASFVWFFGLGYGASLLTPFFAKPSAWRIFDSIIAIVMAALSFTLFRQAVG